MIADLTNWTAQRSQRRAARRRLFICYPDARPRWRRSTPIPNWLAIVAAAAVVCVAGWVLSVAWMSL